MLCDRPNTKGENDRPNTNSQVGLDDVLNVCTLYKFCWPDCFPMSVIKSVRIVTSRQENQKEFLYVHFFSEEDFRPLMSVKGKERVFKFTKDTISKGKEDADAELTNNHNTTTTTTTTKTGKEKIVADGGEEGKGGRNNTDSGRKRRRRQINLGFPVEEPSFDVR